MDGSSSIQELQPIPKRRLYEQVASRMEKLILTEMKPGDKLPTERDLARILGVSRSSLRDALLRLEMLGLIDSRPRSGTVVRKLGTSTLISPLAGVIAHSRALAEELLDFRKMVEPPVAARAARNASVEDIRELEEILASQTRRVGNAEAAIEEEAQFHGALAKAAHNGILPPVVEVVLSLLRERRASTLRKGGLALRCVSAHRQILAAVKRRDPKGAAQAMSRHIRDLETRVSPERPAPRRSDNRKYFPARANSPRSSRLSHHSFKEGL